MTAVQYNSADHQHSTFSGQPLECDELISEDFPQLLILVFACSIFRQLAIYYAFLLSTLKVCKDICIFLPRNVEIDILISLKAYQKKIKPGQVS